MSGDNTKKTAPGGAVMCRSNYIYIAGAILAAAFAGRKEYLININYGGGTSLW